MPRTASLFCSAGHIVVHSEERGRHLAAKANMGVDGEEQEDDGFLEALKGSVENDWADEDEEGWSDEDEEETTDL